MRLYVSTLNCGKNTLGKNDHNTIKQLLANTDTTQAPYDLYALGFQEYVPLSSLGDGKYFSKHLKNLSKSVVLYLNTLHNNVSYELVKYNYNGGLSLLVFAKASLAENIECHLLNSRCGKFGSGLKGASLIRVQHTGSQFWAMNFVTSHLAANEGFYNKRVENIKYIMDDFNNQLGNPDFFNINNEHVLFFGDLNFRNTSLDSIDITENNCFIDQKGCEKDELYKYLHESNYFKFNEFPVKFKPTFKYKEQPHHDTEPQYVYNLKRIPSWCDRILLSKALFESSIEHCYNSVPRSTPFLRATDHQAVTLSLSYKPAFQSAAPPPALRHHLTPGYSMIDFFLKNAFTVYENKTVSLLVLVVVVALVLSKR
ncbi:hypothetical protein ACO0QE_000326 [Hanseniaspora vineae]